MSINVMNGIYFTSTHTLCDNRFIDNSLCDASYLGLGVQMNMSKNDERDSVRHILKLDTSLVRASLNENADRAIYIGFYIMCHVHAHKHLIISPAKDSLASIEMD